MSETPRPRLALLPHPVRRVPEWTAGVLFTLLTLSLLALLPARAQADTLVTKSGQKIEMEGTYEIDGRRVLYRQLSGNLTAIRLSEVDLDATEAANRAPVVGKPVYNAHKDNPNWILQAQQRVDGEPVLVLGEGDREHREVVEAMTELVREMGSSMEEAFGAFDANGEMNEVFDQMGSAMGGAMEEAANSMGSMMGAMLELSMELETKMQGFEKRHDLRTESGMREAAPEISEMASHVRSRAGSESDPAVRQMLDEMASSFDEAARLAREQPAQAAASFRKTGTLNP